MDRCILCQTEMDAGTGTGLQICGTCLSRLDAGEYRYALRLAHKLSILDPPAYHAFLRKVGKDAARRYLNDIRFRRYLLFEDPHYRKYQYEFLYCPGHVSAAFFGNQIGKSLLGTIRASIYLTGDYPPEWPRKFRFPQPTVGRIFIERYQDLGRRLLPKFREWFPYWPRNDRSNEHWDIERPQGYIERCTYRPTGSSFDIVTKKMDNDAAEGVVLNWAWADEPMKIGHFVPTLRGLMKTDGQLFITATPVTEPWMYRAIYLPAQEENQDNFRVHEGDIWLNAKANNGSLTRKAILRFLSRCDPDEREAREKGIFVFISGAAYPDILQRKRIFVHIDPDDFDSKWEVISILDFHKSTPSCVVWMAMNEFDQRIFFDELQLAQGPVESQIDEMLARERDWGIKRVKMRLVDRAMNEDIKVIVDRDFQVFNAYRAANQHLGKRGELPMRKVTGAENSIPIVRGKLDPEFNDRLGRDIQPFIIGHRCRELRATLPLYHRDTYASGVNKGLPKESYTKGDVGGGHFIDCFHYAMAQGVSYEQLLSANAGPGTYGHMIDEFLAKKRAASGLLS